MKSIKSQIVFLIILSILISSTIIAVSIVSSSYNAFEKETKEKLYNQALRYASEFNQDLTGVENRAISVELLVEALFDFEALNSNPDYLDEFELQIAPVIERIAALGDITKSAYVFFLPTLDGEAHDVWYSDLNYNGVIDRQEEFEIDYYNNYIPGREWYYEPKNSKKPYWTLPYAGNVEYDAHIIYVSHTRPVIIDDEVIAIVGSDYHFNLMKEYINSIEIYETGYAFLFNNELEVLIHETIPEMSNLYTYEDGKYKWLAEAFSEGKSGILDYEWVDGKDKTLVFTTLNNGWVFGVAINRQEAFGWIDKVLLIVFVIIIISVIIVLIGGLKIGNFITGNLIELTEHVRVIGDGDYNFALPMKLLKRKDETGRLANSIEIMRKLQKTSFEQITHYNETLEFQISKRTKSLEESNEQLEISLTDNEKNTTKLAKLNQKLEKVIEDMGQTQRQLIESEKIASLSYLTTRLSHEFNTPMGNFTTLLTFLEDEHKRILNGLETNVLKKSELMTFLSKFDDTNKMLIENLSIIKLLVQRFNELDPNTHVTIDSYIYIKDYIEVIIDSMHIDEKYIAIEVLCDPDLRLEIDAGKLSQLFIQLIENSLTHGFKDLTNGMIIIDIRTSEKSLIIRVHDNGNGISKEVIDNIFLPFYSGSLSQNSAGLGLNIVYNIVTNIFHGDITCNSHPEDGTEFIIVINL